MQDRASERGGNGRGYEGLRSSSQAERQKMWDTLERRQVRAIVTLRTGEQYFALNGRNDLSSDLPKQTPEKETTHFVKIEYLAFAKVAGQPPEVILPAPIPVDVNVNEIARVERFANPYLEASFIGKTPQETESFRQLQNQPGAEREREFASAR